MLNYRLGFFPLALTFLILLIYAFTVRCPILSCRCGQSCRKCFSLSRVIDFFPFGCCLLHNLYFFLMVHTFDGDTHAQLKQLQYAPCSLTRITTRVSSWFRFFFLRTMCTRKTHISKCVRVNATNDSLSALLVRGKLLTLAMVLIGLSSCVFGVFVRVRVCVWLCGLFDWVAH